MVSLPRLCLSCLLLAALTACANAVVSAEESEQTTPDPDAVRLVMMGGQAAQLARREAPDAVLLQVDTDLTKTSFRFMNAAATETIYLLIPSPDAPSDQWSVQVDSLVKPGPGIDLQSLKVGPGRVTQAITAHWPGCTVRGLTLYGNENDLAWTAFCDTPEGVVAGSMNNRTGVFEPWDVPPARPPATATSLL